jgi:hypothetical protein
MARLASSSVVSTHTYSVSFFVVLVFLYAQLLNGKSVFVVSCQYTHIYRVFLFFLVLVFCLCVASEWRGCLRPELSVHTHTHTHIYLFIFIFYA